MEEEDAPGCKDGVVFCVVGVPPAICAGTLFVLLVVIGPLLLFPPLLANGEIVSKVKRGFVLVAAGLLLSGKVGGDAVTDAVVDCKARLGVSRGTRRPLEGCCWLRGS